MREVESFREFVQKWMRFQQSWREYLQSYHGYKKPEKIDEWRLSELSWSSAVSDLGTAIADMGGIFYAP